MKPLFLSIIELETLTPPRALTKLARAGISVYGASRVGTGVLRMQVKCKDIQKIFAIFPRSCYTVRVTGGSAPKRAVDFVKKRLALVLAAVFFAAALFCSGLFVLRIRFEGSGSHYASDALSILTEAGIRPFSVYGKEKERAAELALMSLPSVNFCSVEKEGTVVTVTLEENEELPLPERAAQFVCPADGRVEELIVVRGTALVSAGDEVALGQVIVSGRVAVGEGEDTVYRETFPVAYLSLLREYTASVESETEDGAAKERAVALALIGVEGETVRVIEEERAENGKYIYTATAVYRQRYSVNAGN